MTKDELKQEAEEYYEDETEGTFQICEDCYWFADAVQTAYVDSALPREKRIAELEEKLKHAEENCINKTCVVFKDKEDCVAKLLELEKENAELRKVAEFQQSSNMNTHLENKKLKEGLAVGSTFNKALNSMNKALEEERDKYRNMVFDKDEQLTKAKEIIREFVEWANWQGSNCPSFKSIQDKAEQFLNSEVEK